MSSCSSSAWNNFYTFIELNFIRNVIFQVNIFFPKNFNIKYLSENFNTEKMIVYYLLVVYIL